MSSFRLRGPRWHGHLARGFESKPQQPLVSHRTLTVLTPSFNEVANVGVLAERVAAALADQAVDYRHVFIDNASTDGTQEEVRKLVCGLKVGSFSQYIRLNGARRRRPRQ